jgi:hypothetical protein
MLNRLPRLRKFGINTTGTDAASRHSDAHEGSRSLCEEKGVIFSTRVSIDGVGDMHNDVRHVKNGFNKANETIRGDAGAAEEVQLQLRHLDDNLFAEPRTTREHTRWARNEKLDIVFNMVRFTDAMLGNGDLSDTCKPLGPKEEQMRQFFLGSRPYRSAARRSELHLPALRRHDREWLPPAQPVPVPDAGIMLNPMAACSSCENSEVVGTR